MLSFGRRKSGGAGARAALLASAVAIVAVLGTAGSAAAEPLCTGSNLVGKGSSLQNVAQKEVWKPGFEASICPGGPTVTYEGGGSGGGLTAWRFTGEGTINTGFQYIGTDDAPNPAQIKNARLATSSKISTAANVLTIPVTQTSIAIVANPPEGCTVEAIDNLDLEAVFKGTLLNWNELATDSGGAACESPITRVARLDSSGTTYQLKNYLSKINGKGILPCTGGKVWKELEESGTPNTTWPVNSESCTEPTLSPLVRGAENGGGAVVQKVNATAGSIGYAALPDAKGKSAKVILSLQNNGKVTKKQTYVSPASGMLARCGTTVYTVPKPAREGEGTGLNANWSKVFGAKISTVKSGNGYPLCTLTFVLSWNGFQKAGFTEANETSANDYVREYLTASTGQEAITTAVNKWYAPLPESAELNHDVLGSAQYTASKISY
jgi:ABC-type phosphate transport system substrate-binding protein